MTPTDSTLATLLGGQPAQAPEPTPRPANPEEVAQLHGPGEIERVNELMRENAIAAQAERDEQEVAASILGDQGPQTANGPQQGGPEARLTFRRTLDEDEKPVLEQLATEGEQGSLTYFDPDAWPLWRRTALTRAVKCPEPFMCETIEGNRVFGEAGTWLAVDALGFPYPIADEIMQSSYTAATALDAAEEPELGRPAFMLDPFEAAELLEVVIVNDEDSESFLLALEKLRAIAGQRDKPMDKPGPETAPPQQERGPAEPPAETEEETPDRAEVPPPGALEDDAAFAGWVVGLFATGPKERLLAVSETQLEQLDALESTSIVSRGGRTIVAHPFGAFIVAVD